jgi:hypothetical protein
VSQALLIVPSSLLLLAAMLALARRAHRSRLEEWRDLIEPAGRNAAADVAQECALQQQMADHAHDQARAARAALDTELAVRFLSLALHLVEEVTPSRLQRLRMMSRLVRMSMAILPLEAVPPSSFHLARLGALARVGFVIDRLVVAPAERMAVRLKVLALGFGLTLHVLRASTEAATRRPEADSPWARFQLALADWKTLDEEHLASLRALLAAVAVEIKREEIAQQPGV